MTWQRCSARGEGAFVEDIDAAYIRWATRRHTWLWRAAFGPGRKSKVAATVARRVVFVVARLDRLAWRLFVG
jgi:hypothetical protein